LENFQRRTSVADQRGLRLIGAAFGAITAVVVAVAITAIGKADLDAATQSLPAAVMSKAR
jgi:hypothetical protein